MNRLLVVALVAMLGLLAWASWAAATGRLPAPQPPLTQPQP